MSNRRQPLKAPFPYFGGKRRVAALVWERLGDVDNYIEGFCGSAAVLLARPHDPRIETINDADCMVANFWRATQQAPELVAEFADGPVNEVDLHARHRWLVLSDEAKEFRRRMRSEPDYFDAKVAGWWCWGLCCWIGGGWCTPHGEANNGQDGKLCMPQLNSDKGVLRPIPAQSERKPRIDVPGTLGHGVCGGPVDGRLPEGRVKGLREKTPRCARNEGNPGGTGIHGGVTKEDIANGRPQLADAFDIGRGVNSHGDIGTCAARRAWLVEWFGRLRDRLRLVRVCCGDWSRVCSSDSVTVRLGTTGIFFDPPYSTEAGRDMNLYAVDCGNVAHAVRAYCLERGADKRYRICLAGYAGEGHEELEAAGWAVVEWAAQGGYGNRSAKGKANAKKERLWFSPFCLQPDKPAGLFDAVTV